MQLTVNGAEHEAERPQTISTLVASMHLGRKDVAVALDGRVVPRTSWDTTEVFDGASVEVVTAVQGG